MNEFFCFSTFANLIFKNLKYLGSRPITITCDSEKKSVWISEKGTIELLERSISPNHYCSADNGTSSLRSYASRLFNRKNDPFQTSIEAATDTENFDNIKQFASEYIYKNLEGKDKFFNDVKELIDNMPNYDDRSFLSKQFNWNSLSSEEDKIEAQKNFLTHCIVYAYCLPNKIESYNTLILEEYDPENGDPHGRKKTSISTAISIFLIGDVFSAAPYNKKYNNLEFFQFESCINFIIDKGLIISKIDVKPAQIFVYVADSPYTLKKLSSSDYPDAIHFLALHKEKFHPKASWHGKSIDQLVENGLSIEKWSAYGYYENDKLIAYLDYKFRADSSVELGAALVDPDYQKKGLCSSLIYLCRLIFPLSELTSGTYEENKEMIKVFLNTGFKENIDSNGTHKKKDRLNEDYSRFDAKHYTYSVYFITDKLLNYLSLVTK